MTNVLTGVQLLGGLAVAVALFGLLPLWWAVLAVGALAVVGGTAAEHIARRAHSAPSDRLPGPMSLRGV